MREAVCILDIDVLFYPCPKVRHNRVAWGRDSRTCFARLCLEKLGLLVLLKGTQRWSLQ